MNRRSLDEGFDASGNFTSDGIHLVPPPQRVCRYSDSRCVESGRKNVGGSDSPDGDYRITRFETAKQKLERTHLVASAERGVEIVTLDPQARKHMVEVLNRRRKRAELHARNAVKTGKPVQQGIRKLLHHRLIDPLRLA
jgi:hypothetical protein